MAENNYSVRLVSVASYIKEMGRERVVFDVTPSFSESRTVTYTPVSPVHMPGEIQVFRNTKSRTFSIGAILVSRTISEAEKNMRYLQMLRGWQLPYFGNSSGLTEVNQNSDLKGMLGAPPDVLYLWAFSNTKIPDRASLLDTTSGQNYSLVNLNKIPVVLSSLNIVYPQGVTYIPTREDGSGDPFPVKMEVNIELLETHSPMEYEQFSLQQYKNGTLVSY